MLIILDILFVRFLIIFGGWLERISILLNSRDFLEGIMMLIYESLIFATALEGVDCLAKSNAFIF